MINTFIRKWHEFQTIVAQEARALEMANDCILQANTIMKDYKEMYDLRLSQLEESVSALNCALPGSADELGQNVEMEMAVRGLGTLHAWEDRLDLCTFEPYHFDEIEDIESSVSDPVALRQKKFDVDQLREVLDIVKRFSPPSAQDPFTPTIQEGIDPAAGAGESMVTIKEADLRMLVAVIQQYLPVR